MRWSRFGKLVSETLPNYRGLLVGVSNQAIQTMTQNKLLQNTSPNGDQILQTA